MQHFLQSHVTKLREPALNLFESNLAWAQAIGRHVASKLPPSFDPEDLEQVATIEMWRQSEKYQKNNARGTPFRAFAYQAVKGAVLMSIRRRNWKDATAEEIFPTEVSKAPAPDELVAAKQEARKERRKHLRRRGWLLGQIGAMSPVDAYLVKRVYLDEADVEQTAQALGMPSRAASRRLTCLVRRLTKARGAKA